MRISAAMLTLISRQGYEPSTVAEVTSLIGMSRKTFYKQFEDRRSCFIWVCDHVGSLWLQEAHEAIETAAQEGESCTIALLSALFERAIDQPGALRAVMLESAVVRPGGPEVRDAAIERWTALLIDALRQDGGRTRVALEPELASAIFGGIVRTLNGQLPEGVRPRAPRRRKLMDLIPELAAWAASYTEHPAPAWPTGRSNGRAPAKLLLGGRAPGTLAVRSRSNRRRGLPRGENPISRSFVVHSQRERILDAVANLAAIKGYAALTVPEIVQEAAISVQAFYEHFTGKEDAFLVAYEVGHRRALVAFEQAFESQSEWPRAIVSALAVLYDFFASEPAFARCALVEAPSASQAAAALLAQGVASYVPMLAEGFQQSGRPAAPPVAVEALASALHELCFAYAAKQRARELTDLVPQASFIALTPFIGAKAAARIADASPPML